ncbi:CPBP family intramembrane glutamic endopeptidase [Herbiconiux sp. SYSU D00978]|uniref:CPBP family intramembrane glutamic endopeptidase n=1 Tax=Herbiconiux sp. SYSU D00978 TaxID=2812562 RepID=UPI001A95B1E4|nr:CPBP family intramembrane glutamic endopeptidase [Herbiconiux sp. SYSU D00978]
MTTSLDTTSSPVTAAPRLRPKAQFAVFGLTLAAIVLPAVAYARSQGVDMAHLDQAPVGAQLALFGQSLAPGIAALVTWLAGGGRLDWGFRRVPWRRLGAAWLVGVVASLLGFAVVWATGLARFDAAALGAGGMPPALTVALGLVLGVVPFMVLALFEQLGWSSFLAVRVAQRRSRVATSVIVGLAWAAFHVPMMLFVPGAVADSTPVAWAVTMFAVSCVALAFPLVHLRLRTRSIWPVLVMHAALNASLYLVAEPATVFSDSAHLWAGEGGVVTTLCTVVGVLVTAPLWRSSKTY